VNEIEDFRQHQTDEGEEMKPCERSSQALIVASQTPKACSPSEAALDHPTTGQQHKSAFGLSTLDSLQLDTMRLGSLLHRFARVASGFDEIALALMADAWSRTYRSKAVASSSTDTVKSLRGLTLVPTPEAVATAHVVRLRNPAAAALDIALRGIDSRYGRATSNFVALQLEYPLPSVAQ
jgi:hypothetical protein